MEARFVLAIGNIQKCFKKWEIVGMLSVPRNQKKLIEFYLMTCLSLEAIKNEKP
jgi:hypothetical protein